MNAETDKYDSGRRPPDQDEIDRKVDAFLSEVAEYYDSAVVAVVTHPVGGPGNTRYLVIARGNPYAIDFMVQAYLEGEVPPGATFFGPSGLLNLEWDDGVAVALGGWTETLWASLAGSCSAMAVIATAGEASGYPGFTKTLVCAHGNSAALGGALAHWLRNRLEVA